jgi:DNA-binding NarL/FixJ family response regulator
MKIRILVAEDHLVARVGIRTILDLQPDMKVVAEATNGVEALEQFRKHVPDITILDLRMPKLSGWDAAQAIHGEFPKARLIALTSYGGEEHIRRALESGVQAYLTKDVLQDELLHAIRVVHGGGTYLPPHIAALATKVRGPQLTRRELQVLELIVRGSSNLQIAKSLNIGEYTVKNHVKEILRKLQAQDRTQAATEAIQRGIVHLT